MQEMPARRSLTWLPLWAARSYPKRSRERMISRPDRGGYLGMLLDRHSRHERRSRELHRFVFEEKLDGLAQIGERLLDRLALRRRPRLRIESDVAALVSRRQNGGDLHNKLLCDS